MRAWFKLFQRFILRALGREKLRSGFTALGISLGVGVMIAIRLANLSALDSFKAATDAITIETSIQITGTAGRFEETKLLDLTWLRDYGQISPVIEGYAKTLEGVREWGRKGAEVNSPTPSLPSSPTRQLDTGEFLHILGV